MSILTMKNVSFSYKGNTKQVLNNISTDFETGKLYAIVGESGSGKTTLLSLISGLQRYTAGEIFYKGKDLRLINLDNYRSKEIGVIFQSYNLLLNDTALENVLLSMCLSGNKNKDKVHDGYRILNSVGIDEETANRKILKLSGGEQQRVAIARSLSYNPHLIIADEPTGNLDHKNETAIMDTLKKLAHNSNKCIIVVTHSLNVSAYADKIIEIHDGKLAV